MLEVPYRKIQAVSFYPSKILQTCKPIRLKRLIPTFEYKTHVTRLPTQNPWGSRLVLESFVFVQKRPSPVTKTVKNYLLPWLVLFFDKNLTHV